MLYLRMRMFSHWKLETKGKESGNVGKRGKGERPQLTGSSKFVAKLALYHSCHSSRFVNLRGVVDADRDRDDAAGKN